MDILIYNWKDINNPEAGGAEIITFEYARRLVRDGHRVTWFSRGYKNARLEEENEGVRVVLRGGLLSTYIRGWQYYRSLKKKPDIVIDMLNTISWQTPLYIERNKRIAYVNQLAREVLFYELNPFLAGICYFLEKFQFKTYRNTKFICYADSTRTDLVRVGIPRKNIELFSLGLDHTRYYPGEKHPTPLFLCVSRLVKMKRTDIAVRAMSIVVRNHPNARLAVVGYGYQRESLGGLREELGLTDNVFFVDEDILFLAKSHKDQKVKMMQQAWALIFPSVKEGWGMTVTECAACGTPAIVTDVTGLRDSVRKGVTGLMIGAHPAPEELAAAMIRIVENHELREKLSKNAIEWSKNFNWDKSYRQFRDIILQKYH